MQIETAISDADLAPDLEQLAPAAEARWSSAFFVEPQVFAAYAAARLSPGARGAAEAQHHGADLYLACGCTLGMPGAVAVFEAILRSEVGVALHRFHLQPSAIDEVCQMAREKLIVGEPGRTPRIAEYAGRGTLGGWTRVVVTRIALNALRAQKREVQLEEALLDLPVADTYDPELSCLRDKFGVSLRTALDRAMQSLTAEDRVLLRQRFVDGLTTVQLATLYRKHRITMLRRLNGILSTIRIRTEESLERDVGCGRSTAVSIVNSMLSQTHLSIQRYLAPHE
jgi:RNA polymerase sigma-70 factor (ECF subfamily)